MSKIEWPSEKEKWISIGYLAKEGVISSIEATVPKGKTQEFQRKFRNRYDSNYPYEADKYGRQFRIYLNETEGCPTFLYDQLDEQYKNRINDTEFIEELVLHYGFRFTNKPQNQYEISRIVKEKGEEIYSYFQQGLRGGDFLRTIRDVIITGENISNPTVKTLIDLKPHKSSPKGTKSPAEPRTLPPEYLMNLGWLGEAYIYHLLITGCTDIYNGFGLSPKNVSDVVWFNQGFLSEKSPMRWTDQSVGQGCDLLLCTPDGPYYIEVKASKRKYHVFSMTSSEIKKMAETGDRYFLTKVNNLERILLNKSPEVCIYKRPFEYFFTVKQIKEATFYLE